ncbi:hypothetical protein [Streptomyces sp. AC555_RSS877]|nr:hypothetical protein [Streptomyces sp. AC555_RSS877]
MDVAYRTRTRTPVSGVGYRHLSSFMTDSVLPTPAPEAVAS